MKSIIFDLDLTLIDSTIAENARKRREWQVVYSLIPRFSLYPGMKSVFEYVRSNGIKVTIVSTAHTAYVQRVVSFFNIPVDTIVGYHDAARKPSPAGMIVAMQRLGAAPSETIGFGDRVIDIIASKGASITSVVCYWGTKESGSLDLSRPDHKLYNPSQIFSII